MSSSISSSSATVEGGEGVWLGQQRIGAGLGGLALAIRLQAGNLALIAAAWNSVALVAEKRGELDEAEREANRRDGREREPYVGLGRRRLERAVVRLRGFGFVSGARALSCQ